jgi:uncharacterized protein (DUF362 family)
VGKLANLTTVKTARTESFVYTPPPEAFEAARILVKPALGYPDGPPVTVSMPVLRTVLRGLRRANPHARIVIIEGSCTEISIEDIFRRRGLLQLLDDNMRAADAELLNLAEYPNLLDNPAKYPSMLAPAYIGEYDCCISVSAFKRTTVNGQPLISASLKNLYGLFPREHYAGSSPHYRGQLHQPGVPEILKDIYFTVGHRFHGAVVDLTEKFVSPDERPDRGEAVPVGQIVWGEDLLAVDETACRLAGEEPAGYLASIRSLRAGLEAAHEQ